MRRLMLYCLLLLLPFVVYPKTAGDEALTTLYALIDQKPVFEKEKEIRIAGIKQMFDVPGLTPEQRYRINRQLHDEYRVFISDSAIYYMQQNLEIARGLGRADLTYESQIALSFLYSIVGMSFDAKDLLDGIDGTLLKRQPEWLLIEYYGAYKELYRYYTSLSPQNQDTYYAKCVLYRDSLLAVVDPATQFYKILCAEAYMDEGRTAEARRLLLDQYEQAPGEGREKAILTNVLANIYRMEGNLEEQKRFYAISSICDIRHGIKENASMQSLASVLFKTGDIDNAYRCIKSSMDDAMFCNAYLRTFEASAVFPIIDAAYQEKVGKQQHKQRVVLWLVSFLSLLLVVTVLYINKQMKRVARIRKELYHANVKLNELNDDLRQTNDQLSEVNGALTGVNRELSETNTVKEVYLGKFIDLCSNYIDKLDTYRRQLGKLASAGKVEALYAAIKSTRFIDDELRDFYLNFDETFLHIYPTFINEFNELFPESERQHPRQDELMTPELRIYALVRLGIQDSTKIAGFLRYSVSTVYTYRSKLRSKSLYKEDFEERVKKIGVHTV